MISGIIFFKCSKRSRRQQFTFLPYYRRPNLNTNNDSFWRSLLCFNPNIMPGFRKVIAPASFTNREFNNRQNNLLENTNDQLINENTNDNNSNDVCKSTVTC